MLITKDTMARDIAERSGFFIKDVKDVLDVMDDLIKEYFSRVSNDEEIVVQLVEGIKVGGKIVESRERVDPRNRNPIVVPDTVKPFTKFSQDFRKYIQKQYDKKKAK